MHFPPWLEQLLLKSAFPLLSHTITSDNTELLFVHRGEGLYLALSRHKLYRDPTAPAAFRQTIVSSRGGWDERPASVMSGATPAPGGICEARLQLRPPPPAIIPVGQQCALHGGALGTCSPSLRTPKRKARTQRAQHPRTGRLPARGAAPSVSLHVQREMV